ncbi:ATP/GTP-binding protein [[Kitasatospora] papulosa]|uniref:ATP/GTP-binding protein n=1 Tax=[Kitasatospora] papulosa TaxID=1464011 RepID=UPI003686C245
MLLPEGRAAPPGHLAWKGHDSKDGAVYLVQCDSGRGGVTFVPNGQDGPAAPTIDPETVARQAAASMRLDGPAVASPRAAGTYVVGMPMWMWATPSKTTFGPATASATAGGVTVTATAKVTTVRWAMGDGTTVTCHGTPYRKSQEVTSSPDCGHLYERPSSEQPGGRYRGTATAAWTVTWTAPALNHGGTFTETRATGFTAAVHEVQVVN